MILLYSDQGHDEADLVQKGEFTLDKMPVHVREPATQLITTRDNLA